MAPAGRFYEMLLGENPGNPGADRSPVPRYAGFERRGADRPDVLFILPASGVPSIYGPAGEVFKVGCARVIAALGLLALAPLFALIALAVRLDSSGPVIFRQRRVGRHGRVFEMLKFRTMVEDAEHVQEALRARNEVAGDVTFKMRRDPRITRLGWVLRKLSLDELPQLVNILRGEMTLVGPRPLSFDDLRRDPSPDQTRMLAIPGLTGLAQVSGRSHLSYTKMVELDVAYVRRWSIWLDLAILARTVPVVIFGRGAY